MFSTSQTTHWRDYFIFAGRVFHFVWGRTRCDVAHGFLGAIAVHFPLNLNIFIKLSITAILVVSLLIALFNKLGNVGRVVSRHIFGKQMVLAVRCGRW